MVGLYRDLYFVGETAADARMPARGLDPLWVPCHPLIRSAAPRTVPACHKSAIVALDLG